ncbi:hypothetical protein [Gordonia polyisoprenivorans]|uniref:hypothetical protein n=1 Tax=Gordonia polyisoprenivorans TaxID=84595 RepID=UPI001AD7083D|nr:hypothetical protein [Gordonia polyisoprenivorans]QTI69454.1 hypothetical protein J6U32_02130 [Gordonia polyisoprenivorans]
MKAVLGAVIGAVSCALTYTILRWTAADVLGVSALPGTGSWWLCAISPMFAAAIAAVLTTIVGNQTVRVPVAAFLIAYVALGTALAVFTYGYYA